MVTTLIKGGKVFDSDKRSFLKRDVLLEGKVINEVSEEIKSEKNYDLLDVSGLCILPGIIDVHTHGDWSLVDPDYIAIRLSQGITTEIVGNCGFSLFPFAHQGNGEVKTLSQLMGKNSLGMFNSFKEYCMKITDEGLAINMSSLAGHSSALLSNPDLTIVQQARVLEDLLEQGVKGISTGLDYPPGCYSTTEEIASVCASLKAHEKLYVTHMRGGPDWIGSTKEVIKILKKVGTVHVSHLKPAKDNLEEILNILGLEGVSYDIYPFTASQTFITSLIPQEHLKEGLGSLLRKLDNSSIRDQIKTSSARKISPDIRVASCTNSAYLSKSIAQISTERNVSQWDAIFDLIQESEGNCTIIKNRENYTEQEMLTVLRNEQCIVASDSVPVKSKETYSFCHPRLFYTYPFVLGNLVREKKLSLQEAIMKSTSLPAKIFKLNKRGTIKPGYYADIVIGNLDGFYVDNPFQSPQVASPFFKYVFVNGVKTIDNYKVLKLSKAGMIV